MRMHMYMCVVLYVSVIISPRTCMYMYMYIVSLPTPPLS